MKKYLIAFMLLPILMFGQSIEKNYTKTTVFNNETTSVGTGLVYDNYSQIMDLSTGDAQSFFTGYGTGFVSVTILNDVLTVEFNSGFNTPGQVQTESQTPLIMSSIPLPNMVLGDLDCGAGHPNLIKVSILNNMLYLEQNYNYVSVNSFNETFTVNLSAEAGTIPTNANIENITYFDGLGRPIQQVGIKQSPSSKNIVQYIEYDQFGRQSKNYLPFASQNGDSYFETNLPSKINTYYADHFSDINPFTEKAYEKSPIDRIMEQGAPGASWQVVNGSDADHTMKFDYQYNSTSDKVRIFGVSIHPTTTVVSIVDAGLFYPQDKLYKTIVKDENWQPTQTNLVDNTVAEFKDKLGHIVLKRAYNQAKWHDTYYVYDDYGNLTYVLPPQLNTYPSNQQIWPDQSFGFEGLESFYATSFPDAASNEGNVSLNNNNLYFYFEQYGAIPGVALNTTGVVVDLNFSPPLPDMDLGNVTITKSDGSICNTCYTAYLQNGDIRIRANGPVVPAYSAYFEENVDMNTFTSGLVGTVSPTALNDFAYQYKYDVQNRMVEKTLPGKQVEYIVYDKLNRPILTQDGSLRSNNKWLFVKYDAFNRLCYSGEWTNPVANQSRELVQNSVDSQFIPVWFEKMGTQLNIGTPSAIVYYSNSAFPKTNIEVLAINYYDNYTFDNAGLVTAPSFGITPVTNVRSLATGTKTKVLGTNSWITNVSFYDDKGRPIYNASYNAYLGTTNKVKMKLDFMGKILETESSHAKSTLPMLTVTIIDKFTYDHIGRLLTQKQQIDNQPEQLISKNTYNELGNLVSKNVGGKTIDTGEQGLQKVDFNYNIRGWLKDINDVARMSNDLFAINFNYQDSANSPYTYTNGPATPLYNSNICATNWKTDNVSSSLKSYYYNYDNLNRLKAAYYAENSMVNNKYLEIINQYDRNGNILGLARHTQSSSNPIYGEGIDYLTYNYSGNKLMSVKDMYGLSTNGIKGFKDNNTVGDDYDYNFNGNMKFDKNKGITLIEYNHLNLPTKIVFNNADTGSANPKIIEFKYDASGVKIEKKVQEPVLVSGGGLQNTVKILQYDGNAVYKDGILQFFSQSEGYVAYDSSAPLNSKYTYVFQYKDQVGNVRLSYKDNNGDGVITGASTEVFYNGFEANSGWESLGDAMHYGGTVTAYDTTKKHSGNASGKIVKLTTDELYVQSNTWVSISNMVPTDYIISGWIYSDNPSADIFLFQHVAGETAYCSGTPEYVRTYEKNRWVYVEKRITVLPDIVKLALRIDNNGGGTVWFDDVSIRKVNDPNTIEIVEENNFYPFGLKHKGYNNIIAGFGNAVAQQFGYQGQEGQEELGLMWNSFKWRNYDPEIGRFMSVDPLAEKYSYNSTYAFQENKMGMGRELEGLELYNANGTLNETNASNALNGLGNVVFGVVGALATGAIIVGTDGVAAIPLGTSFMLSCAEIGIGIGQLGDALGNNSGHKSLHQANTLPGIIAYENDSEYAKEWDLAGAFLPGLLTGGFGSAKSFRSAFYEVSGAKNVKEFAKAKTNADVVQNLFGTIDAYNDNYSYIIGQLYDYSRPPAEAISPMSPAGIIPSLAQPIYTNFTILSTINPLPTNLPAAPNQQIQPNLPIIENGFDD